MPFHPSNTYTIEEVNANLDDILADVEKRALVSLDGAVDYSLRDKVHDGKLYVDQGIIAGCAGGGYENICAAANILKGASIGSDEFTLSVYPASTPIYMELVKNGAVADLMQTGAIVKTAFCGPCFGAGDTPVIACQVEGQFLDDNPYACIFRYDLAEAAKDYTEYNEKYNEMTQQVMDEMGITQADLDDQTDEGYALLEEFINKLSERGGEYQKYIKDIDIPDTFNLHLDITKVRGLEANYQWSEEDEKKYGRDAGYYKYKGDWSFDIPVTVDDSQTEVLELNDTNDAGIGLKSVIRTPYELTVNELYKEGSNSDCFMVALDANGNTLPYNESTGNCNNFAIQDRDISTVDIYFLDYVQYMDELKGQQNFDNPTKEDGQKWKKLLEENAKYHKTLHFDSDNAKN